MQSTVSKICVVLAMVAIVGVMLAEPAFAAGHKGSVPGKVLCMLAGWFLGNVGKGIAIIAVFIVGTGALMNKISWATATVVGVGIATIFGAPAILIGLGYFTCNATFT